MMATRNSENKQKRKSQSQNKRKRKGRAPIEGISDGGFRQLLVEVSEWYDARGYLNMLKVLYSDHVTDAYLLKNASQTMTLLQFLYDSGDLCPTDLTLLYETVKATKKYGLIQKIEALIPSCPNIRQVVISKFSPYRQKLMKLGYRLVQTDVAKISALYNSPVQAYADSWSLINDLENRTIICEKNMKKFIQMLEKNNFPQAVAALREDIGNAPNKNKRKEQAPKDGTEFKEAPPENKRKRKDQPPKEDIGNAPHKNKRKDQAPKDSTEFENAPPENKLKRKDHPPKEEYDFYIISEDTEWEKRTLKELQNKKPGVKCLSRKNWKYGKFKIDNLVSPVGRCKQVVVGFTSGMVAGNLEFVAATAVQQMLDDNSLDQGKLIPVRITEDAEIPSYLEPITVANGWEEDFHDMLLNTLTEQEIKVVLRCDKSMKAGPSFRPDDLMNLISDPKDKVQNQPTDIPFKSNKVLEHFRHLGISRVDGVTSEPSSLCLLTNDPKVLTKLWSEYQKGRLMEDLSKILSVDNNKGDLSQMWSLYIDQTEYTDALQNMECKDEKVEPAANIPNLGRPSNQEPATKLPNVGRPSNQGEKTHSVDNNLLHVGLLSRTKDITLPQFCTADDLSNFIKNVQQESVSLECNTFHAEKVNLSSITGETLFSLLTIAPVLTDLNLEYCMLSSDIVNDMISRYLDSDKYILKSLCLDGNDLGNIDKKQIIALACKLSQLNLAACKLSAVFLEDIFTKCTLWNFTLALTSLDIQNNDFTDLKGTTLCSLFKVAPLLVHLNLEHCNITGKVLNEMVQKCWDEKLTLSLKWFHISENDIHEFKASNLGKLLEMSPLLYMLDMSNCKLTGTIINEMVIQNGQHNCLRVLYLCLNNLHNIDVTSFVSMRCKFPNLESLHMSDCKIKDNKLKSIVDCDVKKVIRL